MTPNYFILPGLEIKKKLGPWFDKEIIIDTICDHLEVSRLKINSNERYRSVAYCRQLVFFFLRNHTNMTLVQIGALFGKHHSTIIHSCETIKDLLHVDSSIKDQIEFIKTKIINNHL